MKLASLPLLERLADSERVLLAGAGGGFDIFCGLPLMHALREQGKRVVLANLAFTRLDQADVTWPHPFCAEITADTPGATYFPEKYLCDFLRAEKMEQSIYAFRRTGVKPLLEA